MAGLGDRPWSLDWWQSNQPPPRGGPGARVISQPSGVAESQAEEVIRRGVEGALSGTKAIVSSEPVPWVAPTFRSRPLADHRQAILVSAAVADALTSGNEMDTAYGLGNLIIAPGIGSGNWNAINTIAVPDYTIAVISGLGLWGLGMGALYNILWRVVVGSKVVIDDRRVLNSEPDAPMSVSIIARPNQTILVQARLLSMQAPYFIEGFVGGWLYPSDQDSDSPKGTLSRPSQGIDRWT